jgi:protocadherin Fat 1/2/3
VTHKPPAELLFFDTGGILCLLLTFFFGLLFLGVIETSDRLDRESTSHYWLTVYATDQGVVPLSSFIEVYIEVEDVNDNAPQTSEPVYYPEIMENSPKDVSVVQIEAFDPDSSSNDKLTYRITSGNPQGFFSIHPKTGTLCVCVCVCV